LHAIVEVIGKTWLLISLVHVFRGNRIVSVDEDVKELVGVIEKTILLVAKFT
jgi:hypothetical protein